MIERIRAVLLGRTRIVMLVAGVLAAMMVVGAALLDEGEVVRLTITGDDGREHETDVWVVELDDRLYLRAADPASKWLARLRENPDVSLARAGSKRTYRALPDETGALRDRVDRAMADKYGFSDRIWDLVADRSSAIPIRLVPGNQPQRGEFVGTDRNTN
jgi:hypothetical protein